jgi:hypothetical protein
MGSLSEYRTGAAKSRQIGPGGRQIGELADSSSENYQMLAKGHGRSSMMFMSACVVTTQLVVTLMASWSGRKAHLWGRKPLLLIGFAACRRRKSGRTANPRLGNLQMGDLAAQVSSGFYPHAPSISQ